jgi:dTDP-4-dehydrorhamnose reductase
MFWYPLLNNFHRGGRDTMEEFNRFLEYEKEVAELKLKTINRLQKGFKIKPQKRTSKADIAEHVLRIAGRPLHVSEIIHIANRDFNVKLERDSIVSILIKKIKAGQKFIRTAPNTFALKK